MYNNIKRFITFVTCVTVSFSSMNLNILANEESSNNADDLYSQEESAIDISDYGMEMSSDELLRNDTIEASEFEALSSDLMTEFPVEENEITETDPEDSGLTDAVTPLGDSDDIASGKYKNVTWRIDKDYKLWLDGTGEYAPMGIQNKPWSEYLSEIKSMEVHLSGATDLRQLCENMINLETVDLSGLDTTGCTDMSYMFEECYRLKELDVSNFDTSKVTNMISMFNDCQSLEELDLSGFDTSSLGTPFGMFGGCRSLKKLDISSFNTSNVWDFSFMFYECESLESLDVSGFDTSKCERFWDMFAGCDNLKELDVSGFDTRNTVSFVDMFAGCRSLERINVSNFDTSKVENFGGMFSGCSSLRSIDISGFKAALNYDKSTITMSTTPINNMFTGCSSLEVLDLYSLDMGKMADGEYGYNLFGRSPSLKKVYLPRHMKKFNERAFENCDSLTDIYFAGTETEWNEIYQKPDGVDPLANVTIHYNNKGGYSFSYDLLFEPNYPEGATPAAEETVMQPQTGIPSNQEFQLPACTYSAEGYVFMHWNTRADDSGSSYSDLSMIKGLAGKDGDVITLYAIWKPIPVSKIVLSESSWVTEPGNEISVTAAIMPANAYDKTITWKSMDPEIVSVTQDVTDPTGATIKAIKYGTILITAIADDGSGVIGKMTVTVERNEAAEYGDEPSKSTESNCDVGNLWIGNLDPNGYAFTGSAVTPEIRIYDNKRLLKEGIDYSVSFRNNVKVGTNTAGIIVKMKGNYQGTLNETFSINKAAMSDELYAEGLYSVDMTTLKTATDKKGNRIRASFNPGIYYEGKKLVANKDYELEFDQTMGADGKEPYVDAGEWAVKVTAKAGSGFDGDFTVIETLVEDSADKAYVSFSDKKAVVKLSSKSACIGEPAPAITEFTINGRTVEADAYETKIVGSDRVGNATIIIKPVNGSSYVGTKTATYKVIKADISKCNVIINDDAPVVYAKGGAIPSVEVINLAGDVLQAGKDYKMAISSNTSVTKPGKVKISGLGAYAGVKTVEFSIQPQSLRNLHIYSEDFAYSKGKNAYKKGRVIVRDLNGKDLKAGTDYTIEISSEGDQTIPAVGTGLNIKVTGKGNYAGADSVLTDKAMVVESSGSINKAKCIFVDDDGQNVKTYSYTGRVIEPKIRLTLGKSDVPSDQYEIVDYSMNVNKGKGVVTVKGINGSGGLVSYVFSIGSKMCR